MGRHMAAGEAHGYSAVARAFHWVTAALVLTMLPIGIAMANFDLGGAVEDPLYHIHRSIGALVLVITAARLIYRLFNPAPPLPADMPALQQFAALATHWGLYALSDRATDCGLDRHVGLPRAGVVLLDVRAAADLARESSVLRSDVRGPPHDGYPHCRLDLQSTSRRRCIITSSLGTASLSAW